MAFLNEQGLERLWSHIVAKLGAKVDKVEGKGLSTNDYTDEEKEKLAGVSNVIVDTELSADSANPVQNSVVTSALNTLIGDTPVSEQIASSQIVHVGSDMPTDPNIKVWINTAEDGTGVIPVLPRMSTISLPVDGWSGASSPYSQVVEVNTVTAASKIDLQPTAAQIVALQDEDIALMAENNDGVVTIYSFGGKPNTDMAMQVLLTEVSFV